MNIRQVRLGIDVFTGLVVVSVGIALAGLTWRLAGNSGTAPVAAATTSASSEPIDIGGLLALAPFGTAEAVSDTASDGSLHLKGILLADSAGSSTALIAGADGKVVGYGIGAALGGGVIQAIQTDQVILRTPHGLQTVGFSPAATISSATILGADSKAAGFVPASQIASAAAIAGAPAPAGFRISNSAPAALLAAGLQPGDIVLDLNGAPVSAATSAEVVQRGLATAALHGGSVQVVVLRNGNRVSLRLAMH